MYNTNMYNTFVSQKGGGTLNGVNMNTTFLQPIDHNAERDTLYSQKYQYNQPGMMELAYRVPDNLVGATLRNATMYTQKLNKDTIQ